MNRLYKISLCSIILCASANAEDSAAQETDIPTMSKKAEAIKEATLDALGAVGGWLSETGDKLTVKVQGAADSVGDAASKAGEKMSEVATAVGNSQGAKDTIEIVESTKNGFKSAAEATSKGIGKAFNATAEKLASWKAYWGL